MYVQCSLESDREQLDTTQLPLAALVKISPEIGYVCAVQPREWQRAAGHHPAPLAALVKISPEIGYVCAVQPREWQRAAGHHPAPVSSSSEDITREWPGLLQQSGVDWQCTLKMISNYSTDTFIDTFQQHFTGTLAPFVKLLCKHLLWWLMSSSKLCAQSTTTTMPTVVLLNMVTVELLNHYSHDVTIITQSVLESGRGVRKLPMSLV